MRLIRHIAALTAAYAVALQLLLGAVAAAESAAAAASGLPPLASICASDHEPGDAPHHAKACAACILQAASGILPATSAAPVASAYFVLLTPRPWAQVRPSAPATPRLSQGPPPSA